MAIRALLLDLDGTLVDTNTAHTEAWVQAFSSCGYTPNRDQVARAIGMGGDLLVSDVLDEEAEARDGEELREARARAFAEIALSRSLRLFPGTDALLQAAETQGVQVALATSASEEDLERIFSSVGQDLRTRMDVVTTASDVEESKPAPDMLQAVLRKLGKQPTEALFVGDTIYDAEAASKAGVPFAGVATWVWDAEALQEKGALVVYPTVAELSSDLEKTLALIESMTDA